MLENFKQIGLACHSPPNLKSLKYEAPISISDGCIFSGECSIGAFSYLNGTSEFSETQIGRYCSLASKITCGPGQHSTVLFSSHPFTCDPTFCSGLGDFQIYRDIVNTNPYDNSFEVGRRKSDNKITIGNDVWIGQQVIIMNGVTIGDGSIIGTGSIVTKNVEPYHIVAGVPAKTIRKRFPDHVIERFIKLQWWKYDLSIVKNKVDYGKVEQTIEYFEKAIAAQQLKEFKPDSFHLKREANGSYTVDKLS